MTVFQDRKILITRPHPANLRLGKEIQAKGGIPTLVPLLEVVPPPEPTAFQNAVALCQMGDWCIFMSVPAVQMAAPLLKTQNPNWPWFHFCCVGKSTENALRNHGIDTITAPSQKPYDSEALLSLLTPSEVFNRRIWIFRGQIGRELLPEVLLQWGADVKLIQCYETRCPENACSTLFAEYSKSPTGSPSSTWDAMVISSAQILENLVKCLQKSHLDMLRIPIVVISARLAALAKEHGFKTIWQAESALDEDVLEALRCGFAKQLEPSLCP